jgi:hypothetical protein
MQGMDIKYDGHAWSKVITTNIKNILVLTLGMFVVWDICTVLNQTMTPWFALGLIMKQPISNNWPNY